MSLRISRSWVLFQGQPFSHFSGLWMVMDPILWIMCADSAGCGYVNWLFTVAEFCHLDSHMLRNRYPSQGSLLKVDLTFVDLFWFTQVISIVHRLVKLVRSGLLVSHVLILLLFCRRACHFEFESDILHPQDCRTAKGISAFITRVIMRGESTNALVNVSGIVRC